MRFQCTFCFTIINTSDEGGTKLSCPNCDQHIAVPRNRFETGCVISDFVIQNVIGHGGMATVYLARQLTLDRPVALKVLSDEYFSKEKFRKAFLKEAKAAARLNHPNIIQASQVGEEDGVLYYAMEYVQGQTLANKIDKEKTLSVDTALNIMQQAAEALHAAWTQETLIHRDVKPDNIMLAEDGYAKIMDLGIAVTSEEAETAEVSGTPTYMAPEQFRRERLDCRTDIYSLGVTLYHTVCGFPPFDGDNVKEIARKHVFNQLQFPSNDLIYLPQRIKRLISKMMAKEPSERYQDYDELLGDMVALRKRLAPDEDQVPNVHTISFSKYRLHEKMNESPSEIYRRRSDQKKKVAIAKEKSDRESKVQQNRTPWVVVGLLLFVICLLGVGIMVTLAPPSKFETTASKFLSDDPLQRVLAIADLDDREVRCKAYIEEIQGILTLLPESPDRAERLLKDRLVDSRQTLRERKMEILLKRLQIEQNTLNEMSTELKKKRSQVGLNEQSLTELRTELRVAKSELREAREEIGAREQRISDLVKKVETLEKANTTTAETLEKVKKRAVQKLRSQLDLNLVDLCRERKFKSAAKLVETTVAKEPMLNDWARTISKRIANARSVYLAVYGSEERLRGVEISRGTVLAVYAGNVRVNVEDTNLIISAVEVAMADISADDMLIMAEQVWPGQQQEYDIAAVDYALMRGAFKLAYDHAKQDPKMVAATDAFVSSYLKHAISDVQNQLGTGNVKLANARYKSLKSYVLLPIFSTVEVDFRALSKPE